jgi:hypothetical protein
MYPAAAHSMCSHFVDSRIMVALKIDVSATMAAASSTPTTIDSNGIATSASPKPNVERVKQATNRMATVTRISESINLRRLWLPAGYLKSLRP